MSISELIFYQMKKKGISQKKFSELTGIPESTISDWKKKGNIPKADKLYIISKTLGISLYELLGINDSATNDALDYSLSDSEIHLIEAFRSSAPEQQKRIITYSMELSAIAKDGKDHPNQEITQLDNLKPKDANRSTADAELLLKKQLARRLRRLARLDRIQIDESDHSSGLNKHLFKYLDYLGIDKLDYVKKYLSSVQPFMLTEMKSQEKFENAICVLDGYYRISLYIKVDATKGEEIVVSFHENNKDGIAKVNSISRNDYVYVFADSVGSHLKGTDDFSINLFITRGVSTFPINVPARQYDEEGFLVRYSYINNALIDISNRYLEDLYTADIDFSEVEPFSSIQQLSFTSFGNDIFSNISLLIDSILIQKDAIGRQISDAALVIYCNSLELLDADKNELMITLRERFKVNSKRVIPGLIDRIDSNIR
ncbi:helix-turn-helix domain-containing protein [Butyrivibrio sp. VCD2006]|uniref:helix-turn-helix domain-containing protein n=1 Tax=Butyrivibrio sp. VCD2006 TaxID=1280664 RepID=UPI00041D8192|nr:helix-turn-helix transcriptional regulator [Butyrivibrio sp. VCD2006]